MSPDAAKSDATGGTAPASSPGSSLRWVFLDRDGTLNVKPPAGEYVERPAALELLPGAAEAVGMLNRAGLWTGLVTNQRGVALGRMSLADLDAVHERLAQSLGARGAHLDAIYACPHGLGECDCRKPAPGLLLRARDEYPALDFARAAIVGDSPSDIEAGKRLGLRTVLIRGDGEARVSDASVNSIHVDGGAPVGGAVRGDGGDADYVVADPLQAARLLLAMA